LSPTHSKVTREEKKLYLYDNISRIENEISSRFDCEEHEIVDEMSSKPECECCINRTKAKL
jgi:hypothetical protein